MCSKPGDRAAKFGEHEFQCKVSLVLSVMPVAIGPGKFCYNDVSIC